MSKTFIGIDPGKNGAVTIINENSMVSHIMPLIGKEIDIKGLYHLLKSIDSESKYCVVESVHAIFGASAGATFEFGYGVGIIEGLLAALEIPCSKIAPKAWQKQMFEGVPLMTKPSSTGKTTKTDTKNMATIAAQRIFPNHFLKATSKCKKVHDGIVDSVCIAEYCRRNFKQ